MKNIIQHQMSDEQKFNKLDSFLNLAYELVDIIKEPDLAEKYFKRCEEKGAIATVDLKLKEVSHVQEFLMKRLDRYFLEKVTRADEKTNNTYDKLPSILTISMVADLKGVKTRTVQQWIKSGKLMAENGRIRREDYIKAFDTVLSKYYKL